MRTHLLLTTLLSSLVGSTMALPAADFSGRLELQLDGPLAPWRDGKFGKPARLDVYAECDRGQWRDVWAESDEFNRAIHLGGVTEATVAPGAMRLKVKRALGSDNWIKGGPASFELELKRERRDWERRHPGSRSSASRALRRSRRCRRAPRRHALPPPRTSRPPPGCRW